MALQGCRARRSWSHHHSSISHTAAHGLGKFYAGWYVPQGALPAPKILWIFYGGTMTDCSICGVNITLVGKAHRCIPPRPPAPVVVVNTPPAVNTPAAKAVNATKRGAYPATHPNRSPKIFMQFREATIRGRSSMAELLASNQ